MTSDLEKAIGRFHATTTRELPRPGRGSCPICGHNGCFGRLPDARSRWAFFSSDHPPDDGVPGTGCVTGDLLDLELHELGRPITGAERVCRLKELGFLDDDSRPEDWRLLLRLPAEVAISNARQRWGVAAAVAVEADLERLAICVIHGVLDEVTALDEILGRRF